MTNRKILGSSAVCHQSPQLKFTGLGSNHLNLALVLQNMLQYIKSGDFSARGFYNFIFYNWIFHSH